MKYLLKSVETKKFVFNNERREQGEYKLSPKFGKKIDEISDKEFMLSLSFSLHNHDDIIAPFDIDLTISGSFILDECNVDEQNDFMNMNAVAILFPYLRSILSTTLSSMMIQPIILPIVDAVQLFSSNDK